MDAADLQVLLLGSTLGLMLMVQAHHLLMLFIAVEMAGVPSYALAGFPKSWRRGSEAALKFAIFGAAASGLMLYGITLLCGVFGTGYLPNILDGITRRGIDLPVAAGAALLFIGLGFKLSVVPLHFWCPDVFEGAAAEVAAFLGTVSKVATATVLLRLVHSLQQLQPDTSQLPMMVGLPLGVVAALSMTVGNLAAITQSNVKRLLAYSSISHAGYILLGLVAGNETGIQGVLVYVLVYTFMNLGAFLVLIALRRQELLGEHVDDLSGLVHKSPGYAFLMLIFLLSLAGIPPTAGFIGKYFIFLALIQTQHYLLAVVATLYVAVAVYYYFRLVRSMFTGVLADQVPLATSFGLQVALAVTGVLTLAIGVYPQPFVSLAEISVLR
ncbi:MAG: NADH-quinone oxidoreductase subunit N [Bryobacteraceae bacterium]|nr:NADH-quinone oxidoreductase subunit N [Bryobacteraceae bacterium]